MSELPELEPITPELEARVEELAQQGLWGQLSAALADLPPADIALLLARFEGDALGTAFKNLPDAIQPDVLSYLPSDLAADLAADLPTPAAADIANEMAPDDAADLLGEMPAEDSDKIIAKMDQESADEVRRLMTYPKDSAGGIMTTDLVALRPDQTVLEALDAIARDADEEHIYQVYVTDARDVLLGSVTIWDLLRQKDRTVRLGKIMETEVQSVSPETDQETVAQTMAKYDLSVIAVVGEAGALLGRITHDDAADIIQKEAEEDILRLAGTDDEELGHVSAWRSCWYRLPWLFITLLGGIVSASILCAYNRAFHLVLILSAFIPNVMGMGGNTGLQSSVLMIREISAGPGRRHSLGRLFRHELRTGALMGLICGSLIFLGVLIAMHFVPSLQNDLRIAVENAPISGPATAVFIAVVVGIALFCAMTFAAAFGAVVPIVLDRLGIDTAVASGPFISVMDDISSVLIYYGVSLVLIQRILPLFV